MDVFYLSPPTGQVGSRKPDIVLSESADSRKAILVRIHFGDIYLHPIFNFCKLGYLPTCNLARRCFLPSSRFIDPLGGFLLPGLA